MPRPAAVLLPCALAACSAIGGGAPAARLDPCLVARAGTGAPAVVHVVTTEPINLGHAPVPRTDGEAFVFTQLYANLAMLGCDGRARPMVATGWAATPDSAAWTVTLDAPWQALQAGTQPWPPSGARWPATGASVGLAAPEALAFAFAAAVPDLPLLLSDPGLALLGVDTAAGGAPRATATYRLDGADASGLRLEPAAPDRPVLEVRTVAATGMNLLDHGTDLLLTRDQATIAAAAADRDFAVIPLGWDRVWVVAGPPEGVAAALAADRALVLEGVAGDLRPAGLGRGEWIRASGCPQLPPVPLRGDHLGYLPDDPVARQLVARLVALAQRRGLLIKAVPWQPGSAPAPAAVVLAVPTAARATCAGLPAWPAGWSSTPVAEGRATAVVRVGAVSLVSDGRGTVRVAPAVPEAGE